MLALLCFTQMRPFQSDLDVFRGVWHLQRGPYASFSRGDSSNEISPRAFLRHGMVFPTAACDVGCRY